MNKLVYGDYGSEIEITPAKEKTITFITKKEFRRILDNIGENRGSRILYSVDYDSDIFPGILYFRECGEGYDSDYIASASEVFPNVERMYEDMLDDNLIAINWQE